MNFIILFAIALLQAPANNLPEGWYQLDMLSYHGPTGYFHDKVSGALVQYYFGPLPPVLTEVAGSSKCKTRSIKGTVPSCIINIENYPKSSQKKLQVIVGPIEYNYAIYWTDVNSKLQEERSKSLMLQSPLWERSYADQKVLKREAQDKDVSTLRIGMNIEDVYTILGYPLNLEPRSDAGFSANYEILSKRGPMKNWRSYQIELVFSKDRILKSILLPDKLKQK